MYEATPRGVNGTDDERVVEFPDDEAILPGSTRDDTDAGWGEPTRGNDDRLLDDRPPHWN